VIEKIGYSTNAVSVSHNIMQSYLDIFLVDNGHFMFYMVKYPYVTFFVPGLWGDFRYLQIKLEKLKLVLKFGCIHLQCPFERLI
jgi:hypothetical protein